MNKFEKELVKELLSEGEINMTLEQEESSRLNNIKAEKILLLQGIERLQNELDFRDANLDSVERMLNLVGCLVALNWKEVGRRDADK